jgi:hypothetical protein
MQLSNQELETFINILAGRTVPSMLSDRTRNRLAKKLIRIQREQTTDLQDRIVELSQAEIDNRF